MLILLVHVIMPIYIAREGSTREFCACLCVSQSVLCVYCGDRIN